MTDLNTLAEKEYKNLIESFFTEAYDFAGEIDVNSKKVTIYFVSELFNNHGLKAGKACSLDEVVNTLCSQLIVEEEKEAAFEQFDFNIIRDEIQEKNVYVRTAHIVTESGVHADNIRIKYVDNNPDRLLFTIADITALLDRDWMTDEYSRTGFQNAVAKIINELDLSEGYSIIYANIEGLKAINSIFGSGEGDMFIFHEREILRSVFSPLVFARFEADHFVMLTKSSNITEDAMNEIRAIVHEKDFNQYQFKIQCGIYNITDPTLDIIYMVDCAKLAEKSLRVNSSKNYCIYDEAMNRAYVDRNVLVSELDEALANNEFKTFYQPIVDARTGKIVSAEALVRWVHHDRGMIPPYVFIEAFEKKGLVTKIDYLMARNVIKFNQERYNNKKKFVPCSVNLSRMDFYDTRFMERVMDNIKEAPYIRDFIKFEVTESSYAVLEQNALEMLKDLQKMKVSILLDDFGSGMSSMSTLESFDFNIVKLDMGFVRKIGNSLKGENIIKAIINLAHSIGAKVVAEGVETKEQLDFLVDSGCDMIQGYYFYKPMPEEDFEKLLDE